MSRRLTLALAGVTVVTMAASDIPAAWAAPLPAGTSAATGSSGALVDRVRYRGGYYGGRGRYGYRRGVGPGGALAAGAALGLIGGALAASAAPRYGYYDYGYARPAYGYGYPAYGYGEPAYGYGYPAYGY